MNLLREYIRVLLKEQNVLAVGMCFPFAAKKAEEWFTDHFEARRGRAPKRHPDLNNKDKFKVVHGKITDQWKEPPKPIVHAWVEMGDLVFDDQTQHTKPNGVPKDVYYDMYQPEVVEEYTAEEAVVNCDMKGEGPWNKELQDIMKTRDAWMNETREIIRTILDRQHADGNPWEVIFQKIRDHKMTGSPMPNVNIDDLATMMNSDLGYDVDREAFAPTTYETFDDWFLRNLTDETLDLCLKKASLADVCSPVQGTVRKKVPAGEMTLKRSVIAVESLLDLMGGKDLLQISLQKTDYHRVHSPVDGRVTGMIGLKKDELFPGSEAMTVIKIDSSYGEVKVMCIGEWSVQTFMMTLDVGTEVSKLDELGYFYFGSQVIIILPDSIDVIADREGKERVFPGDPIGLTADVSLPTKDIFIEA